MSLRKSLIALFALFVMMAAAHAEWHYLRKSDAMTGAESAFAVVKSENTFILDSPYGGEQRAELVLRRHPRFGSDVMVMIERGQILCDSYNGCSVLVRFDEHPARTFSAVAPADNSSDSIFLRDFKRFYAAAAKAKTVLIELPLFQNGKKVMRFDISGFDPKQFQATQPKK